MKKKHFNIPIFIPELACPFQCIYCDQRKISGMDHVPDDQFIRSTIERYLTTIPGNSEVQLAYFGGNFTGLPLQDQKHYLQLVTPYIVSGQIRGIRVSTRPDYINDETLTILKNNGVESIELGAQSLDDSVLKESKRGHTLRDIELASEKIKKLGFSLGLQMMIGLPGDTLEKSILTAHRIVDLGAEDTRLYPTLVIKGTQLEKLYNANEYHPLSLTEAVHWSSTILLIFEQARIKVLKLGLHPTEGLMTGHDLVAGPFHPSFRELVETQIWYELLFPLTKKSGAQIEIIVAKNQINYAVGYHAQNKKALEQSFRKVKFRGDEKLDERSYQSSITT